MSSVNTINLRGTGEFLEVASNSTKEMLVMASLKAPLFEQNPEDKRAPIDLCCVLDKSGSMAGAKLALVKNAMTFVLSQLDEADRLSVVTFESAVETLFDFTKMDAAGKQSALGAIEKITHAGSTNLLGGLVKGMELVNASKTPSDVTSVLLFTDGQADGGQTTPVVTAEMQRLLNANSHAKKPTVFTFGFGSDHNENFLRSIAEAGSGMYYFVSDVDKIPVSFADCLGGLQSVVAQNLTLQLDAAKDVKILKSLNTKYKISKGTLPSASVVLELGDLYSEEERDVVFVVELPVLPQPDPTERDCVHFKLSYFNVLTTKDETATASVKVIRPGTESADQLPNEQLDKQRNRLRVAEAMEKSRSLADGGDMDAAKKVLKASKEDVMHSHSHNDTFCIKLAKELDDCVADMETREAYISKGSKAIMRKAQAHAFQRSNRVEDTDVDFYETRCKSDLKKKAAASNN